MTGEQSGTLVLKDSAGTYYLVPQEMLERGRVPRERNAELEQFIEVSALGGGIRGDDVYGHNPVAIGVASWAVFYWGASMGYYVTKNFLPEKQYVPEIDYSHTGNEPIR